MPLIASVNRIIVHYSHWLVWMALASPIFAGTVAYFHGGNPIEAAAYTAAAIVMAGGVFGLMGLVICMIGLFWVILSIAF